MKDLMYDTVNAQWAETSAVGLKSDVTTVIAKSGTAQIFDNKNNKYLSGANDYIYSYSLMFPYEKPEIIIYAAMKKPTYGASGGLTKATKNITENIAKYLQLANEDNLKKEEVCVSSYINKNVVDFTNDKLNVIIIGEGDKIVKQYPKNTTLLEEDNLFLITNEDNIKMIDLKGYSKSEVINLMNLLDLNYELDGEGYVVDQSIKEGTEIKEKIIITLKDKEYMEEH